MRYPYRWNKTKTWVQKSLSLLFESSLFPRFDFFSLIYEHTTLFLAYSSPFSMHYFLLTAISDGLVTQIWSLGSFIPYSVIRCLGTVERCRKHDSH